jgi:hypothetical protein
MIAKKILIFNFFCWSSDLFFLLFWADFPPSGSGSRSPSNADPDSDPKYCQYQTGIYWLRRLKLVKMIETSRIRDLSCLPGAGLGEQNDGLMLRGLL